MNKSSNSTVAFALLARAYELNARPILCSIRARLAAAVLLTVLLVPSAFAQFIYVANAGEDTVSKIDINSKVEVARYATWFTSGVNNSPTCVATYPGYPNCNYPIPHPGGYKAHEGPAPSRIARDSTGSAGFVYVLNRFFSTADPSYLGNINGPHFPVLLKIAVAGGSPTSTGSTPLAIQDLNNDNDINTGEAADKAIIWAKSIGSGADITGLGRALAIDKNGFLWVGMYSSRQYWKVDPNTGNTIGLPVSTPGHSPYGCQIDINGHLWSVDEANTLAEIDTTNSHLEGVYPHPDQNYSLSIFNDCSSNPPKVKVYLANRSGHTYIAYDPQAPVGSRFSNFTGTPQVLSYAVGVDKKGNIVSGASNGQVIKTTPTGTLLWSNATVPMTDLHGIIIDDNDDVWAVDRYGNQVIKYDGMSGTKLGAVPVGIQPYTYGNTPPPTCSDTATPTPTPSATPTSTPACAQVTDKEIRCLPDGSYSYTFNVANSSAGAASQVLLTRVEGSPFTLGPQLSNLSSPLQNGQSTTVTTSIGHVKPGEKVCFFVTLMSDAAACCTVKVCPTLPQCGEAPHPNAHPTPPKPPSKRRR